MEERQPRKLAVILHADVVGSTALVQRNEALAHERIQDAFRRFSGTIESYNGHPLELRGDALVAEFNRASDAVGASLAFQAENTRFNSALEDEIQPALRIGISLGEVVVADNTVTGEGIVLAQRLEQLASNGGVCIQGAVYEAVPGRLPFEYESLGERRLKGISEPVRAYAVSLRPGEAIPPPDVYGMPGEAQRGRPKHQWIVALVVTLLVVVVGGLVWWQPWAPKEGPASVERMALPLPDKPSIAVLPFDNLSGDPHQDYVADGITEDIITAISKFRELFVIARNSSFTYRDKPVKVQQVAEDLGVRYVLEGSYRKSNDRLRITAQLIDAQSGSHVWAETYDRNASATFTIQDEIVDAIVTALAVKVEEVERLRATHTATTSVKAYDHFLRGRDLQIREGFWNSEVNQEVRRLQEKATTLDPQFSRAYAEQAWTHLFDFIFKWVDPPEPSLLRAFELARKAVSLDPSSARAHYAFGYAHLYANEHELAAAEVEKAIALNPNDARFRAGLAGLYVYGGDPHKAIDQITEAMRLNPYHEDWYWHFLGWASFHAGKYEEALAALKRIVKLSAGDHRVLAATYARLDRLEEAAKHAKHVLQLEPDFVISHFRNNLPYKNKSDREAYLDALSLAGLPE